MKKKELKAEILRLSEREKIAAENANYWESQYHATNKLGMVLIPRDTLQNLTDESFKVKKLQERIDQHLPIIGGQSEILIEVSDLLGIEKHETFQAIVPKLKHFIALSKQSNADILNQHDRHLDKSIDQLSRIKELESEVKHLERKLMASKLSIESERDAKKVFMAQLDTMKQKIAKAGGKIDAQKQVIEGLHEEINMLNECDNRNNERYSKNAEDKAFCKEYYRRGEEITSLRNEVNQFIDSAKEDDNSLKKECFDWCEKGSCETAGLGCPKLIKK